jgi:hypothetical protein
VIVERIVAAFDELEAKSRGKRRPKAVYLSPADWAEFESAVDARIQTGRWKANR